MGWPLGKGACDLSVQGAISHHFSSCMQKDGSSTGGDPQGVGGGGDGYDVTLLICHSTAPSIGLNTDTITSSGLAKLNSLAVDNNAQVGAPLDAVIRRHFPTTYYALPECIKP